MITRICYIDSMVKTPLSNWLEQWYLDWQKEHGRAAIKVFAAELGVSQGFASQVMNGHKNISLETCAHWARLRGDYSIYEICGYPRPEEGEIYEILSAAFPESADKLFAAWSEIRSELVSKGITTRSPEATEIIKQAFSKRGLSVTTIKTDDI